MQDEAPRKPLHSADKSVEEELAIPQDWESRLAEARERRKIALAERAASKSDVAPPPAKHSAASKAPSQTQTQTEWDKRMAAARANRAKVLAERQETQPEGYGASPQDFRLAKANADHARSIKAAATGPAAPKPDPAPEPKPTPTVVDHGPNVVAMPVKPAMTIPEKVALSPAPLPVVDDEPARKRVSALPVVIFACFFGVGVGLAAGWGLFNFVSPDEPVAIAETSRAAPAEDVTRGTSPTADGLALSLPGVAPLPRPALQLAEAPAVIDALTLSTQPINVADAVGVSASGPASPLPTSTVVASLGQAPTVDAMATPAAPLPALIDTASPKATDSAPALQVFDIATTSAAAAFAPLSDTPARAKINLASAPTTFGQDDGFVAPLPLVDLRNAVLLSTSTLGSGIAEDLAPPTALNFADQTTRPSAGLLPAALSIQPTSPAFAKAPLTTPAVTVFGQDGFVPPAASDGWSQSVVAAMPIPRPSAENGLRSFDLASLTWTLPEVGEPPVPADQNFAQALGLSPAAAAQFGVYLFAPGSITEENVSAYQTRLSGTGLDLKLTKRVEFKITKTQIRFYTEGDRRLATSLADELGIVARDFTANGGNGGRIEVWMKGEAGASAPKPKRTTRTTTTRRAQPQPVDTRTRLTNSIIEQLRRN